jgi:hypothetical protein
MHKSPSVLHRGHVQAVCFFTAALAVLISRLPALRTTFPGCTQAWTVPRVRCQAALTCHYCCDSRCHDKQKCRTCLLVCNASTTTASARTTHMTCKLKLTVTCTECLTQNTTLTARIHKHLVRRLTDLHTLFYVSCAHLYY